MYDSDMFMLLVPLRDWYVDVIDMVVGSVSVLVISVP